MQFKSFAVLITVAVLGGIFATGCSKSADSSSSSDSSAASSAPAAAASADGSMSSPASQTVAAAGDPTKGEAIFGANCASCHGAQGSGGGIGPSLKGERSRKDTAAAITWIKNPQPPMPKLYPSPLSEKDVADVAAYVESL
jgi:mono/diheme cytochrome c family protein